MKRKIHFKKELDVNRQKAFDVVSKFDEYSEFLPGCTGSSLIKRDFPTEIGRLECNILGKEYFIISENTISEDSITTRSKVLLIILKVSGRLRQKVTIHVLYILKAN